MARLGDVCEKITDYVASGSFAALKENVLITNEENYAIMVKTADFSNGFTKGLTYTDKRGYDFLRNSNLFGGELILSNIGSIGKVFKVPYLECPMTLASNTVMVKTPTPELSDYLYYYFLSPSGYKNLLSISSGTSMLKFNKTELKKLEVPVPDIDKQRHIIAVMDKVSSLIAQRKEQLAKLDELVKARFVEMFGNDDYPSEQLNQNVVEMFIGPFGSSMKNEFFVDQKDGFCMVYEQKHAIQKTMDVPTRYITKGKYDELKRFTVMPGDIIVSCRGTIGEAFLVPDDAPMGIMHPSIMKIRLNGGKYNQRFFLFALDQYMMEHNDKAKGSGVKMAVSAADLGKSDFVCPPLEVQNEFSFFVEQTNKTKLTIQASLDKLEVMKKALMQEYFG